MSEDAKKRWYDRAYACPGRPVMHEEVSETTEAVIGTEEVSEPILPVEPDEEPTPSKEDSPALGGKGHDYIRHDFVPVSWLISPTSKHVSYMMCMKCFEMISMSDMQNYSSTKK